MTTLDRRRFIAGSAAALASCTRVEPDAWQGGWVGDGHALGHRLREPVAELTAAVQHRTSLAIVGAGIGGLAAARAAMRAGIDDLVLLDLHDSAGGNSRGHAIDGAPCPLGAHYLPAPGPQAREVREWLHEIGLAREAFGRTVYDERHLCHSPQERLYFDGAWHEGLLPPADPGSATLAQYRRFAQRVDAVQRSVAFALPTRRAAWTDAHARLDAVTFAQWLDGEGLADERLRWYLDYCCRDDYGAGTEVVSAWAGLHYFASRHGFHAGGDDDGAEREAVLTWPEGNAWLVQRLAAGLGDRHRPLQVALRVSPQRHDVTLDLWNGAAQRAERWTARQVVMAVPLFVAARTIEAPGDALREAASMLRYAPWLVANLQLDAPLLERAGAPMAWDNVSWRSAGLGYVNAQHQALAAHAPGTLLTAYRALGVGERNALFERPWAHWAQAVVDDLAATHPDLPRKLKRIDLARHGHAMSIPLPGVRGHAALRALAEDRGASPRLHFAHADLAGSSVFEEAFTAGDAAGRAAAAALHRR